MSTPDTNFGGRRLLTLIAGVLAVLALPSMAYAGHPRPKSATPMTVKLVPAAQQCTSPSGNHVAPLVLPACGHNQSSSYLTLLGPDRPAPWNGLANFTGYVTQQVINAGSASQDIKVTVQTSNGAVVCLANGQGNCSGGAGSTYNGKVLVVKKLRISDHGDSFPGCPYPCAGTMVDFSFQIGVQCSAGNCALVSSYNSVIPGMITTGLRGVIEEGQVEVHDAGLNGQLVAAGAPTSGVCPPACVQDDPSTLFMVQGLFSP
jgi:hypothetical protein